MIDIINIQSVNINDATIVLANIFSDYVNSQIDFVKKAISNPFSPGYLFFYLAIGIRIYRILDKDLNV